VFEAHGRTIDRVVEALGELGLADGADKAVRMPLDLLGQDTWLARGQRLLARLTVGLAQFFVTVRTEQVNEDGMKALGNFDFVSQGVEKL